MNSNYIENLFNIISNLEITDAFGKQIEYTNGVFQIISILEELKTLQKKVIFIGNGGSAGITSHMAVDFLKNGKMRAMCFNDAALLTCMSNDYGFKNVFNEPLKMLADPDDFLFAISSSGQSQNILLGVEQARYNKCKIVTFSGFSSHNPLRKMGDLNIFIPSNSYGIVELSHQIILHMILDIFIEKNHEKDKMECVK